MKVFKKISLILASVLSLSIAFGSVGCKKDDGMCTVKFDTNTTKMTNRVLDQTVKKGDYLYEPPCNIIEENPDKERLAAWCTDKAATNVWDFDNDTVKKNMTLYAKWIKQFTVTYLVQNTEISWPVDYEDGGALERHDELCDGYSLEGYYYDKDYKNPVDFDQPVTKSFNIYMKRSDTLDFNAKALVNRFFNVAAAGAGSEKGTMQYVEDNDGGYAEIDFGYSTSADPQIQVTNPVFDIRHSQKLQITFKNLGNSPRLKFYWITRDMEGNLVSDRNFLEENCFYYDFKSTEKKMDRNGEWATATLDLDSIKWHGVSTWGSADTLVRLRIDSAYKFSGENDVANVVLIKSIKGIENSVNREIDDTVRVSSLCRNDSASALEQASNAQDSIIGFNFPKDGNTVSSIASTQFYQKTSGLAIYAPFRGSANVRLTPDASSPIELDSKTTVKIRLRNYGYVSSLAVLFRVNKKTIREEIGIEPVQKDNSGKLVANTREYVLNMYETPNYTGTLEYLQLYFDSVGIDNLVVVESIEFTDFMPKQLVGFNFNDINTCGVTSDSQNVQVSYNETTNEHGTKVVVSGSGSISKQVESFTILGYKGINLSYICKSEGISKVNVSLTVDGEENVYAFDVESGSGIKTISKELIASGNISNVSISFEGTGEIILRDITFSLPETAVDFSNSSYFSSMLDSWKFDASYSSVINAYVSGAGKSLACHLGPSYPRTGITNFDLEGKSKIIVIYQNTSETDRAYFGFGTVRKDVENYATIAAHPIGGASYDQSKYVSIQTNMKDGEWAAAVYDINAKYTSDEIGYVLTMVEFRCDSSVNIRAVIVV